MRCEQCGRPIKNADMWQLGGNPLAPTSRSMQQLCWDCRQKPQTATDRGEQDAVVAEAVDVIRNYETDHI